MRILVVEDDLVIAENLQTLLRHNHFLTDTVRTADDAMFKISSGDYDAVIMDWMLPDGNGPEICSGLRKEGVKIPILMLTAKSQMHDIVRGLEGGADEFMTKPYRAPELLARLQALLRRRDTEYISNELRVKNVRINTSLREVFVDECIVNLSPREYDLLLYLFRRNGEPVDRLTILTHVWGDTIDTFSNTVDVHIRYLRKKLGSAADILRTIKGMGYCICER